MKQKNKISLVLNCIGVLIFVAMGLGLTSQHNNLMIFLGIACFIVSAFVYKILNSDCKDDKKL